MMGCFPKPIHMNVTALIQAYPDFLHKGDIRIFVAASQQLHSGLNEACGEGETFTFLCALLMMVEKLKTLCLGSLYDLNCLMYA